MPIILCRHGQTDKNKHGGADDLFTPLDADGAAQAAEIGICLLKFCLANPIRRVEVITSGSRRTDQTAQIALEPLRGLNGGRPSDIQRVGCRFPLASHTVFVADTVEDPRIGEIKLLPESVRETPRDPGLFGRRIDYFGLPKDRAGQEFLPWRRQFEAQTRGKKLARLVETFQAFDRERLRDIPDDTLVTVWGHRTSNRVLTLLHTGRPLTAIEALPVKGNCAMWQLEDRDVIELHRGFTTRRDDERIARRQQAGHAGALSGRGLRPPRLFGR